MQRRRPRRCRRWRWHQRGRRARSGASPNRRPPSPSSPTATLRDAWPTVSGAAASAEASTLAPSPAVSPPATDPPVGLPSGGRRRRLLVLGGVAAAVLLAAAVAAWLREQPARKVPTVVSLRPAAARAQILQSLPGATVSVRWVYSTRVSLGRVISQRPAARTSVGGGADVRLTVSKGTPFAEVPAVPVGASAPAAKRTLARTGFSARLHYTPSWTVRKGAVIELRPRPGVRLRRPATVSILVASGYPREVVPQVENADLVSARSTLEAKHLRYQIVYRLMPNEPANQVVGQIPSAGAIVYRGSRIRLAVARTYRWVNLFRWSGTDRFQSDPFTVPARWRIRYRLAAAASLPALAQFALVAERRAVRRPRLHRDRHWHPQLRRTGRRRHLPAGRESTRRDELVGRGGRVRVTTPGAGSVPCG